MNLIGIHGPAGSGKDTSGAHLINTHGFERLSFATPMYKALYAMGFGWPTTQADKEVLIDDIGVTWRHLAQTLGTEWGRQLVNQDLWLILAARQLAARPQQRFVITDVRFENEAEWVRQQGGKIIHLRGRGTGTGNDTHESEQPLEVKLWDAVIVNDGTLTDLHIRLQQAILP